MYGCGSYRESWALKKLAPGRWEDFWVNPNCPALKGDQSWVFLSTQPKPNITSCRSLKRPWCREIRAEGKMRHGHGGHNNSRIFALGILGRSGLAGHLCGCKISGYNQRFELTWIPVLLILPLRPYRSLRDFLLSLFGFWGVDIHKHGWDLGPVPWLNCSLS